MIKTIELSPYISVQGMLVSKLPGGRIEISLNGRRYVGLPIGMEPSIQSPDPLEV